MIRIQLDDTTRDDLRRLRHTNLADTARDRLEMILLSDAGWSPPRIAQHRGCHPHTARAVLKGYQQHGVASCSRSVPVRLPTTNVASASPSNAPPCWASSGLGPAANWPRLCGRKSS
jgi:hypothetical protein